MIKEVVKKPLSFKKKEEIDEICFSTFLKFCLIINVS